MNRARPIEAILAHARLMAVGAGVRVGGVLAFTLLALCGCLPLRAQATPTATTTPELEGGITAILLTFALVALLGDRLITWAMRLGFSLGIDTSRTLFSHVRGVKWTGVLVLAVVLLRWLLTPLPSWAAGVTVLLLSAGLLVASGVLGDVVGGLVVHFRLGLREGDHVQVGQLTGQVEDVQLLRLRLRTLDDDNLYIPNRRLLLQSVQVSDLRHAFPVEITVGLERTANEKQLRELRETLMFLPYRVPSSALHLQCSSDGRQLTVLCYVWSHKAHRPAEAWVRARCSKVMSEPAA